MSKPSITQVVKFIRKGEAGANAPYVELSRTSILYEANEDGHSTNAQTFAVECYLKADGATCSIASTNNVTVTTATEVTVTKNSVSKITIGIAQGRTISGVVTIRLVGTLNGKTYSAQASVSIEPNKKGSQGPALRGPQAWSDCASGYAFQAGGEGEVWKDVVLYNGNYYTCIKSHTKTSSNYPASTTDTNNKLWKLGDKIELVATKILLATYALVKNLGVEAIDMKDGSGNIVFQAKDGNVICKKGTFENVVVSGTLNGVSGSFKNLDCVDNDGNKVGGISFGSDGKMWFAGDLYNQGYDSDKKRGYRFYSSAIWCRGTFGARQRNILEIRGSYGYYYTKGADESSTYVSLSSAISTANETYYKVPCYGGSGDYSGMPVDIIVFKITSSTTYRYLLEMSESQRVLVVNANDDQNNVQIYSHGGKVTWNGGELAEVVCLPNFAYPAQESTVLGRGLFVGAFRDNNW